jgi:hypothetical protein
MNGSALRNRRMFLKELAEIEAEYRDKKSRNQEMKEIKLRLGKVVRKLASHIRRYGESER